MIFNIDKETMPREKIREIQLSRLQDLCRRVYANVPFYRRSFDEKGIKPSDVQSLDDLKFLPFTLKQDMRNNYPYGLFAVPMEMIQRIHASSGTTGKATVVGYTKRDIETWAECAARSLAAAGATANDIVQVSYGYGLFTGGLGAHYGAERLGATVIPMSRLEDCMIFNIDKETMPREKIREIQLSRLQDLCRRVYANVPFYRRSFDEKGIKPSDVQSLDDLKFLPFTLKQDMRNNYPYGLFAVPMEMIQRIHASSGTTGKATVVGYTKRDIETWAECAARSLAAAGATANDIVQVSYGYGLFTGGLGAHYGAERLGATVIPMSGGSTKRQVQLMRDFGATVLCCTPSYALHLHDAGLEIGINIKDLPLRLGVFGAEPWTEEMRREIEDKLGITATNIYGLSEIMGPGVSQSCAKEQHGMHIWEDHFLPEIIDPVSGEILPEGSTGELVITTLTKQGIPLVRYRTRDITSLNYTPCSCGRTHVRMNRITGRSDDMLIIRGVNVFPSQIESLLLEVQGVSPHYQLILTRENNLDYVEVQVELDGAMFSDAIKDLQQREQRIQKGIKEFLGVTTKVRLVEPHSIPRSEGKAVRVIDRRVMQ